MGKNEGFCLQMQIFFKALLSANVELAAFLMISSSVFNMLILQNLTLERACTLDLNQSSELCADIVRKTGNHSAEETSEIELGIQELSSSVGSIRSLVTGLLPIPYILLIGPLTDIYGRKFALILPVVGYTWQALGLIISSYFQTITIYEMILLSSTQLIFTGTIVSFNSAAFSYVCDKTEEKWRTIRCVLFNSCYTLGTPFGFVVGGLLTRTSLSYVQLFLISGSLSLLSVFIIVFFTVNTIPIPDNENGDQNNNPPKENQLKSKSWLNSIDPHGTMRKTFSLPFSNRNGKNRNQILILFVTYIFASGPLYGEFTTMYLFLRYKFNWDAATYSLFTAYIFAVLAIGAAISMGILTSWLKLKDALVGLIGSASQFSACFVYAFAPTVAILLLAPLIDFMNGTMMVIIKVIVSKLLAPNDFGAMFSLFAFLETVVPSIFEPIYLLVYRNTINSFPGAIFLFSAALTIPVQLVYLYLICSDEKARDIVSEKTPLLKHSEENNNTV